jgi:RNA polymerase sigma-70 factor (ECF subfamily)
LAQGSSCERFGLDFQGRPGLSPLVIAAQRGDTRAFRELMQDYDAMVMRVALMLTSSQAAAQQIYCRVFREAFVSVKQVDSSSSVFIWLYRILVKHCLEYCRRRRSARPSYTEADSSPKSPSALLATLPPTEHMVLLLRHFQNLKVKTLAEVFNCPPEFIVKALQDATNRLRRQLKPALRQAA